MLKWWPRSSELLSWPCSLNCRGAEDSSPAWQTCVSCKKLPVVGEVGFPPCQSLKWWSTRTRNVLFWEMEAWVDPKKGLSFSMLIECLVGEFFNGIGERVLPLDPELSWQILLWDFFSILVVEHELFEETFSILLERPLHETYLELDPEILDAWRLERRWVKRQCNKLKIVSHCKA